MPSVEQAVLWPSREHYPRFRAICGDSVQPDYDAFVAVAQPMVDTMERDGTVVRKVDFDPDDMATWCRREFGEINSTSRAAYIAALVLSEGSDAAD